MIEKHNKNNNKMLKINYNKNDKRYIFISGDLEHIKSLESHLNKIPQYMFLPSFIGVPKPVIFLNKIRSKKTGNYIYYCFAGLWKEIDLFGKKKNIKIEWHIKDAIVRTLDITREEFENKIHKWNLKYKPYDYQIDSAYNILKYHQSTSEIATRAGKTLIAYIIFRYLMEEENCNNILMIVPSISLVKQGYSDFNEYSEFFKTDTIWAQSKLVTGSNMTIGTFQSLISFINPSSKRYNPSFFKKFDVICVDECHFGATHSIESLLSQEFMKNVKICFGFTGTLPLPETIESFKIQSLIGPKIQDIRSKELIDNGFISPVEIKQYYLKYPNDDDIENQWITCGEYLCSTYDTFEGNKILLPKNERLFTLIHQKTLPNLFKSIKNNYSNKQYIQYLQEMCSSKGSNGLVLENMVAMNCKNKINFIINLLENEIDKNCIIFCHHTSYITFLYDIIKNKFADRKVWKISGNTSIKVRDKIKDEMVKCPNGILIASYGCVGTGLTFKNLHFGILTESFKSHIINKQTIGRGLCKSDDKEKYIVYDLIDCMETNRIKKIGKQKYKLYLQEEIPVEKNEIIFKKYIQNIII